MDDDDIEIDEPDDDYSMFTDPDWLNRKDREWKPTATV
jgi:hypothetical protein